MATSQLRQPGWGGRGEMIFSDRSMQMCLMRFMFVSATKDREAPRRHSRRNGMVKLLVLSRRSSRRKLIGASLALALPTALAISGGALASAATPQPTASPVAPAYNGSAAGGKVIVVLRQQQAGMNLRTQARQRIASAHADQAPIVAAIRSHGGTGVTQLAAPDAVAATMPAAEGSQLRDHPAGAEIVPHTMIQVSQVHTEAAPPAAARGEHVSVQPSGGLPAGNGPAAATIAPL